MSEGVHRVAQGFNKQVDSYERARPAYPDAALSHVTKTIGKHDLLAEEAIN
jgi:hypothetical protein